MAKEITLVIIKPHVFKDHCPHRHESIIQGLREAYEKIGIRVIHQESRTFTREEALNFYGSHEGKPYFEELMKATVMGPCVMMILEGEDAIQKVRDLHGPTQQSKLERHHLRYSLARRDDSGGPYTGLHASDSADNFILELSHLGIELPVTEAN